MELRVRVDLPSNVEHQLRGEGEGEALSTVAREAVALALFQRALLSHAELGEVLGLDRFETDALLKRHQVWDHSLGHDEVDADLRSIDELLGPPRA